MTRITRQIIVQPGETVHIYGQDHQPMRLSEIDWKALERAEDSICDRFAISYTSVNERTEDRTAAAMWQHAEGHMEAAGELDGKSPEVSRVLVAKRVARALAILVWGPEYLLK